MTKNTLSLGSFLHSRTFILFVASAIVLPVTTLGLSRPQPAAAAVEAASASLSSTELRLDGGPAGSEDNPDSTQAVTSDDHGNVFAVYVDDRSGTTLFFNRSTDFAESYGTDVRIDRPAPALSGTVVSTAPPRICTDGKGTVYASFHDTRETSARLFMTVSRDYGATWSAPTRISGSASVVTTSLFASQIACDHKGNVYAVYQDDQPTIGGQTDVYFVRSGDYGATWSSPVRMDADSIGVADTLNPVIVTDGSGRVVVAYQDSRNGAPVKPDIFARTSSDYGLSFGSETRIDTNAGAGAAVDSLPMLATDDWGRMYIAWSSGPAFGAVLDIYFSRSTDGGVTWSSPIQLNGTNGGFGGAGANIVANTSGVVIVAYHDVKFGLGTGDTYIARSTDFGATFATEKRVNTSGLTEGSATPFGFPEIAMDRYGNVVVAYSDDRLTTFDDDVFYNYSEDSGATWQSSDLKVSTSSAGKDSHGVHVAMDNRGRAVFVYSSDRTGPGNDVFSRVAKFTLNDRAFDREGGTNRYDTGAKISKDIFADRSRDAIVIASGGNFPDAIVGGPLANMIDGPLLLSRPTGLPSETAAEILRVFDSVDDAETDVYILGGTAALNASVETTIKSLDPDIDTERVFGARRIETALAVAEKIDSLRGSDSDQAFLSYSGNFPDALSASGVAGSRTINKKIIPILLNTTTTLDGGVESYLRANSATLKTVDLTGGTAVLANSVFNSVDSIIDVVNRRAGSNRYGTAAAVASAYRTGARAPLGTSIATGENFPDALTGGVHAAYLDFPIMLVRPTSVPGDTSTYLSGNSGTIGTGTVYGGPAAVADSVKSTCESLI